jgi:hypothetical protein
VTLPPGSNWIGLVDYLCASNGKGGYVVLVQKEFGFLTHYLPSEASDPNHLL